MKKINLKCKNSSHMHSNDWIKLKVRYANRVYIDYVGKSLTQISMKYTYKWVSYEANKCMFK